jgi:hypothetical protein
MVDPITVISTISSGLALVDKFTDIVRKLRKEQPKPYSVQAAQEANALVIRSRGAVAEKIDASELHLNEWDDARYQALQAKVRLQWGQFNALDAQLPTLAIDEKVRIEQRMELMRKELCGNFRQMIDIYEKTLGTSLSDHYSLYLSCRDVTT